MINYQEHILKAIDYIEENLRLGELNITAIASAAGYSKYHFLRVFYEVCGLTPSDYVRKRRISEIVRRISIEKRPISDISFEFGFNSKENFIRAFKTEHHILPTELKAADNSLKHNARKLSCKLSGGRIVEDFGVCKWNDASGKLDYYIGVKEMDAKGDRSDTILLNISGGTYAVFDTPPATHFDFVNVIHRTWEYIGQVWLTENGYIRTGDYELESYIEASRLFSERIYIPIKEQRR